jgi:hypothetical protein
MQFEKRTSVEGNFAKKGVDILPNDIVEIMNEGRVVDGQYGTQNIFKIEGERGEFLMSFNQTSLNALIEEWGTESTQWIGKKVKVHSMKQNVSGKFLDVYYVAPYGYEMSEYGFVKVNNGESNQVPPIQHPTEAEFIAQDKEEGIMAGDVALEDIPF